MSALADGAVTIRPLGTQDVVAVAGLEADAFPAAQWTADNLQGVVDRWGWPFLVATRGEVVVGFAAAVVASGAADILTLAVSPSERRRGLGSALLAALESELEELGVETILLEVRAGNRAAVSLYRGAGYVEVGERRRYYPDGEDAVVMRKG